jgi:two-component system sensor histidine kinase AlgZ
MPDFCGVRPVLAVVVSAELLAMVLALATGGGIDRFWSELSVRTLYVQWIALSSAALVCLLRRWLGCMSHALAGMVAWLLIMLVALLVVEAAVWLIPRGAFDTHAHADLLLETLGISGITGALVLRYLYENYQQKQRELAEGRARLRALQARIRPHFLFNSINTIITLIPVDPDKAENTLHDLSDLFRASLSDESRSSTLEDELLLVRQYLEIEQQRLGDRLQIRWDLHELPGTAPMPVLTLQPLVENAVYHGIEPSVSGGEITLHGRIRNGVIALAVTNTLPPDGAVNARNGNHMAQENVRQRLLASFGDAAGASTGMVDDKYQMRIWFPVKRDAPS